LKGSEEGTYCKY